MEIVLNNIYEKKYPQISVNFKVRQNYHISSDSIYNIYRTQINDIYWAIYHETSNKWIKKITI